MKLVESKLTSITYTSESSHETTTRTIVPVKVPTQSIRAIDVSELSEENQREMAGLVAEYKEYLSQYYTGAFNFEDWAAHTKQLCVSPKWRSFRISGIKTK